MEKLLIANRGEIAVRIIRAAREMGIRTAAVFSEADEGQMHVSLADEAFPLGASEAAASYLDSDKILHAAKAAGADAIHPGYGFLSERASFSRACRDAGIVFVGPPPEAMERLGSKIEAKQLAVQVGVPVTPGYFEPGATATQLKMAADQVGYPIMLKASAGGGGRGMRAVRDPAAFDQEISIAADEALKAFGNGEMMLEKLIERPRHIEVQVLADSHGNVVALFERECSIQRRNQKVIEEAPSAWETCRPDAQRSGPATWPNLRAAAIKLAAAAGYVGAGTVEFMVDPESWEFYFLEVNARLQVEHPTTEMITGIDLVKWQLRIARGERLDLEEALQEGDRRAINGHAVEARIVAEDPAHDFRPSIGRILAWAEPKAPGVRVDSGYATGSEVSRFYDSLVAKVIAHAETRGEALARLEAALLDFHVLGVKTNIAYLIDVIRHPEFKAGNIDTGFLSRALPDWNPPAEIPPELLAIADSATEAREAASLETSPKAWDAADGFRIIV